MTGKRIGYIRVSTVDQNPERQLENIAIDKRFIDYASGKSKDRPQLKALIDFAREDDVVIVHSMDRLGRNVKDIIELVDLFLSNNIQIEFIKENLRFKDKKDPVSNCILTIFAAVAEFEYSLIKERQMEGILIAKKAKKFKGGIKKLNDEKIELMKEAMKTRKSKTQIADELGICRFTLYKYLKEQQQAQV